MLAPIVQTALFALAVSATAIPRDVCSWSPYSALMCLSTIAPAASACSAVPPVIVTTTVTTTLLAPTTLSTSQHARSQVTVSVDSISTVFTVVTSGAASTVTETQTRTRSEYATITGFTSLSSSRPEAPLPNTNTSCNAAEALGALAGILSNKTLATACSCFGHPVSTSTLTIILSAPAITSTTTEVGGTAPTTTLIFITQQTLTLTKPPVVTTTLVSETCKTITTTISSPSPIYSHIWGPEEGCKYVRAEATTILDCNITDVDEARRECEDICSQHPSCLSVYLQQVTEKGEDPHYHCYFGDHHFDPGRDVECGKLDTTFGAANGYDVLGR